MFPHGQPVLGLVDEVRARLERLASVRGTHGRDQSRVTDLQRPHAMQDRDRDDVVACGHLTCDLSKHGRRRGMTLVLESGDVASVVVVSHITAERDDGTRAPVGHERLDVAHRHGHVDDIGATHECHGCIMSRVRW